MRCEWPHANLAQTCICGVSEDDRHRTSLVHCRFLNLRMHSCFEMWMSRHHPNHVEARREVKERICDDQRNRCQHIGLQCITEPAATKAPHLLLNPIFDDVVDRQFTHKSVHLIPFRLSFPAR